MIANWGAGKKSPTRAGNKQDTGDTAPTVESGNRSCTPQQFVIARQGNKAQSHGCDFSAIVPISGLECH
jgi:hypothetical protein